jgi:hypothetical protein
MLGFPNRIDDTTLSGGSWEATLPLTNLQNRTLGKVARSTDTDEASTKFDIAQASDLNNRTIALVNHNMSLDATVRVYGSTVSDFATTVYDSGAIEVWPAVYSPSDLEWEDNNWWSGRYSAEEREGYTWAFVHVLPTNVNARYWRVVISDTTNAAGYVQIGRVFLGPVWQPEINMAYGVDLGWNTDTQIQKARSGAQYFDERNPQRNVNFAVNFMSLSQAMGRAFELQRRAGVSKEVLYIFDPADTQQALRRQFLGRLRELSPIEFPTYGVHNTGFSIEELL